MSQDNLSPNEIKEDSEILIETPLDKFRRSLLDQTKEYPLPEPVINLIIESETFPLFTLKSLSLLQGKQKSKKTTLLALIIAAYIRLTVCQDSTRFEKGVNGKALICDMEQGSSYAARTMKTALRCAGLDSSPLMLYADMREFTPRERLEMIEAAVQSDPDIRLVIIDGFVDVMNDFMDANEAMMVITKLAAWSSKYNIHISGVLHQNKADRNARAHIGSIAVQKSEIEIMTEVDAKNPSQSIVKFSNTRGLPIPDFAIQWQKGSLPSVVQDWSRQTDKTERGEKNILAAQQLADKVFKPLVALRSKDAVSAITKETGLLIRSATTKLKDMEALGLIKLHPDKHYRRSNPNENE